MGSKHGRATLAFAKRELRRGQSEARNQQLSAESTRAYDSAISTERNQCGDVARSGRRTESLDPQSSSVTIE